MHFILEDRFQEPLERLLSRFHSRYNDLLTCQNTWLPSRVAGLRCGVLGLVFSLHEIATKFGGGLQYRQAAIRVLDLAERENIVVPKDDDMMAGSFFHADATYAWLRSFLAVTNRSFSDARLYCRDFVMQIPSRHDLPADVVLGAAGWLLALVVLREHALIEGARLDEDIQSAVESLSEIVWSAAVSLRGDLDYNFAHGLAGIVYALIRMNEALNTQRKFDDSVLRQRTEEIAQIASSQPKRVIPPYKDHPGISRSSFCHGSAGQTFFWLAAFRYFQDQRFLELAASAAAHSGQNDLYRGDACLCCGTAGQAYALYEMYRVTGNNIWLQRAHQIASVAAAQSTAFTDGRKYDDSLYLGILGPVLLAKAWKSGNIPRMPFM